MKNTQLINLWGAGKVILRGEFIAMRDDIKNPEISNTLVNDAPQCLRKTRISQTPKQEVARGNQD